MRIDARPWNTALRPALEDIRERLGLPLGRLVAKLHKLLVYETDDEALAGVIDALLGRHTRYLPDTLVDVLGHLSRKRKLAEEVRA